MATKLPRVFRYNSVELEDPGAEHDPVDVRNLYAATYPEILNAAIEGPEEKDGKHVYTFRKAVGTKGAEEKGPQIGRLAMREEGLSWVAYYAPRTDSMEHAILLGSITMTAVVEHPERKQQFMDLMRELVGDIVEEVAGVRPIWGGPERAPEHERAGRG